METETIKLLKNQNRTALAQLYDAYSGALYGVVLRIVCCKELAQQVIQDTFLKAWQYSSTYDESKGRVFTWLLSIARNTAIDATRTTHFQYSPKTENTNVLIEYYSNECFNPDTIYLREMIYKLDKKYQQIIELIYFQGYTQEAAAAELGLPYGTVKTRVRSAISELRQKFA